MTRKEHLEFCRRCLNRKLDTKRGLVCKLTDEIADFEDKCENLQIDHSVQITPKEDIPPLPHQIPKVIKNEDLEKIKQHQDFYYAIVGGALASIVGAILWALITVSTNTQIGYMAIGIGIIVGFAIRYFGAGIDKKFGLLGGLFSLFGCVLGNFFSQIGFIATAESMTYLSVFSYLDVDLIKELMFGSFHPMDVLFYGIAIYEGYKFSFRQLSPILLDQLVKGQYDGTPANQKLRMPLATFSTVLVLVFVYFILSGYSGHKFYKYDTGEMMSEGDVKNNKEQGLWTYYYKDGTKQAEGNFEKGKAIGSWKWYYDNGELQKTGNYQNGMEHGVWINYYPTGTMADSVGYVSSRLHGYYKQWSPEGQIIQEGNYIRNKQDGVWSSYYPNGNVAATGEYNDGNVRGEWNYYYTNGQPSSVVFINTADIVNYNKVWDLDGKVIVANGNGTNKNYYENGTMMEIGKVKDGKPIGVWKQFYENGTLMQEYTFDNKITRIQNFYDEDGKIMVKNGEGSVVSHFPGTDVISEMGAIKDGVRDGEWIQYYTDGKQIFQKVLYKGGIQDGVQVTYFQSGQIATTGQMKEGKQIGEWTWYYENGMISSSVTYVEGEKEGVQKLYDDLGTLCKEEKFDHGKLISEKYI